MSDPVLKARRVIAAALVDDEAFRNSVTDMIRSTIRQESLMLQNRGLLFEDGMNKCCDNAAKALIEQFIGEQDG
jgi:hypothetical protein